MRYLKINYLFSYVLFYKILPYGNTKVIKRFYNLRFLFFYKFLILNIIENTEKTIQK